MALNEVGRVGIRAIPETRRFRADLKKSLDRIEKTAQVKVQATATLTKGSLARIRDQLGDIEASLKARIGEQSLQHIKEQIEDIEASATVDAVAETAGARSALQYLARPRVAVVHVRTTGIAAASAALARISGARVASDIFESIGRSLSNLDKSVPKISAVSTAIAGLSGMLLAGVSNSLALGASIASIAGAALALPGIIAGFGVGLGVMIAALKDAGDVLADLGPAFTSLQDSISANFWDQAAQPIRDLVNSVLPDLQSGLGQVSTDIGGMFAAVSSAFESALGGGVLQSMLDNLSASIQTATGAAKPLVDAFVTLGGVGSEYLEPLAAWLVRISERFDSFIQTAAADGSLKQWIDTGIENLFALGEVIANVSSIFAGLADAAQAAGGASLQVLADGLGRVADVVNGPVFQGALTTVFEGAHAAMEGLARAGAPLGDMFASLAPTIARVLELAGQIAGDALGGIADALNQPAFATGLTAFFEGIQAGVQALLPVLPVLAQVLGQIGVVAGTIAGTLGTVLAAAFAALAPIAMTLLEAVQPLIPLLGDALVSIIAAIAPGIQAIVAGIAPLVAQLVGALAPIIATLATALLPPLLSAIASLTPIFATVLSTLLPFIVALVGQLAPVLGQLASTVLPVFVQMISMLVPIFSQIMATLLPLVMSLVSQFAPVIQQLASQLMPVLMQAMSTLVPVISQVLAAVLPLVATLVSQLAPIIAQLAQGVLPPLIAIFGMVVTAIAPLITQIASGLIPIIQALMPVVVAVFGAVVNIITSAMQIIQGIIQVVTGVISGNWSQVWSGIQNITSGAMNLINSIIEGAMNIIMSIISSVLGMIANIWNSGLNAVRSAATSIFNSVVSFIASIPGRVMSGLAALSQLGSRMAAWVGAAKDAAVDKFTEIVSFVSGIPGKVMGALGDLGSLLVSSGASLIQGFLDGIAGIDIGGAIGGVVQKVRDFFPFSPAKTGPFSGRGYTTYSGQALVRDFAGGMESQANRARAAANRVAGAAQFSPGAFYSPAAGGGGSNAPHMTGTLYLEDGALLGQVRMAVGDPGVARATSRSIQRNVISRKGGA